MNTSQVTYVLDSSVFLTFPDLLKRDFPGVRLVVPSVVLEEFAHAAERQPRFAALAAAINGSPERFQILDSGISLRRTYDGRAKDGETAVLAAMNRLQREGAAPILVTEDRDLLRGAEALGLASVTSEALRNFSTSRSIAASQAALAYEKGRVRARRLLILGNLAIGGVLALAIERSDAIVRFVRVALSQHPSAAITLAILLIAISAHAVKRWNQYWYGSFEVVCGCFFCYVTARLSSEAAHPPNLLGLVVAYAGGAFTVVRGLGNIHDGLSTLAEYPKLQRVLRRLLDPGSTARDRRDKSM